MALDGIAPSANLLLLGVLLDALLGDPEYSFHPFRLMGKTLSFIEAQLRSLKFNGYGGGCILLAVLTVVWVVVPSFIIARLYSLNLIAAAVIHVLLVYSLLSLRDLLDHVWSVQRA